MPNRLHSLHDAGQSIWLDYIDRSMLQNGSLARMIKDDALTGMTSNPTIFEKALSEGTAYDDQLATLANHGSAFNASQAFEAIETDDVRTACDLFRGVYDQTKGGDGYVSIEVSPLLANDANGTIAEAQRLWRTVNRPNVMVKVPGTVAGATAIRALIGQGINVNVTLLFAIEAHAQVIEAYLGGLEDRAKAKQPISGIASVASFFVSRVDTEIDKRLDAMGGSATGLKGKAAIANAKLAYKLFQDKFSGDRWNSLSKQNARVQRPLWASTSTKNPAYRDVMYAEALIGPDTVDTMPPATMDAFRDHGNVARTVDKDLDSARKALSDLEAAGISMKDVTDKLLVDGIASFKKSFETLLAGLSNKVQALAAR